MKNVKLIMLFTIALITILMVSCEKNKLDNSLQAEKVKKILEIEARINAVNSGTGKMTSFMSVIGYSQFKDGTLNISGSGSGSLTGDSIFADSSAYWQPVTCAKVTETDNPDGTHTTVFDYGDGCDEYGSLTKGKITYIWKNEENTYISEVIYEDYYAFGVKMNGISKYTFTSDGNSYFKYDENSGNTDSTVNILPITFNWSGSSTGFDDLTLKYDDGNIIVSKSDYSNEWDSISFRVLKGEYYYSDISEGYEYYYDVTKPLITDYLCFDSWVPVKGVEIIKTVSNGVSETYSLDYGDGECDNLAKLTENGKTSIVDFSELFKIINNGESTVPSINNRK